MGKLGWGVGLWLGAPFALALELPLPPEGADLVGQVSVIKANYEDTFADYTDRYELGFSELQAANPGVDAWLPGAGTDIVLPARFILPPGPRTGIVINLPEYRLYYYPANKPVVYTYPIGIGREGWGSPVGATRISAMTPNPAWYPPKSIRDEHAAEGDFLPTVVPAGPNNPLGPYKMTLALPGYLIHGSNKNFGIGQRVSHGCFRMLNDNVMELSKLVGVGTSVRIINEPYKVGTIDGKLYVEAHSPLEEDDPAKFQERMLNRLKEGSGLSQDDLEVVKQVLRDSDGLPVQVSH